MGLTLYSMSGSPYAWRVALALEHKGIPYTVRVLSLDAGDFKDPAFAALNPRRRVPVIVDGEFVLYESAAIVEYLDEAYPDMPRLFAPQVRERALQRRLVREADQYVGNAVETLVETVLFTAAEQRSIERIGSGWAALRTELGRWEAVIAGQHLAGALSAADFTLYPLLALARRIERRVPEAVGADPIGPQLAAWMERMHALPIVQRTWPPHWKP
ncbi:MAG: glutathione S-transferase family protein [Candidatus Accumulibacter cognatus]|uniref:Glutathione S-transferase family protein n=1 Tax=Candidatus Accumulibacter cognatus TaxID=2954383 RepID=A0A7D5NA44_9PROT|nr:MAG: glutathione S-transferase family protein [Candidatus Accumulibacter cognatus]